MCQSFKEGRILILRQSLGTKNILNKNLYNQSIREDFEDCYYKVNKLPTHDDI